MSNQINWQKKGNDFFQDGQYEKSFQVFKKCMDNDIEPTISGLKMGLLLCKMGRGKEGQKYLEKYQIPGVGQRLLQLAQTKEIIWPGLSDCTENPPDKKTANIFFLSAILDYQMDADWVWAHTKEFAETTIPNPSDLWRWITDHSFEEWKKKWKEYGLHRFPAVHERVWTIGKIIVDEYEGDVRNIWLNQPPDKLQARIFSLVGGVAILRMILGALLDTHQISSCRLDVKPDVHVCTMLYRLLYGTQKVVVDSSVVNEIIEITRQMNPKNPWVLDDPLFSNGKNICTAKSPNCSECPLMDVCAYNYGINLKNELANPKLTQLNLTQFHN
jgi:hypothetical protein